jgi:AcrR family transcriptional regulator
MSESVSRPARRGRPSSEAAASHAAIMDAVYELLQEKSVRDLTMEAVAKRAGVGKPTLYKWWPSKGALVFAMFHERIAGQEPRLEEMTAEATIRAKAQGLIREFNGLFGKVMADLIAEGQSDPAVLRELYEHHMRARRAAAVADVERGKANGEFRADTDPTLLLDAIFAPLFLQLMLQQAPLTEQYGEALIDQVIRGVRL